MNNYTCPHCGSEQPPVLKSIWSTKDIIITIILFLTFFPLGIVYLLVKNASNKQRICLDCNLPYEERQKTSTVADYDKIKNVVKTVVKDPRVRQSVKDLKNSAVEFHDTFDVN